MRKPKSNPTATPESKSHASTSIPPTVSDVPDWVDWTPEIHSGYFLQVQVSSIFEQEIELTLAEYLELKAHLAKMRGYTAEGD